MNKMKSYKTCWNRPTMGLLQTIGLIRQVPEKDVQCPVHFLHRVVLNNNSNIKMGGRAGYRVTVA